MGITDFTISILDSIIKNNSIKSVCELGSQQTYVNGERYGQYANWFYEHHGIRYFCIDLNGENKAWQIDLSKPQAINIQYDLVTDCGTMEHVGGDGKFSWEAVYNCWHTKHKLLKRGGIMLNENPRTQNWPGHGFNYIDTNFYYDFVKLTDYEALKVGIHPAVGNTTDGWNVFSVLKKHSDRFPTLDEFKLLSIYQK